MFCFVLMPFHDKFGFVYEYGIKPALQELSKEITPLEIHVERADERLAIKEDKVQEIIKFIKKSDLTIVDVTGGKPNVLWELGFCHALEKSVIVLSQSTEDLPFNIKTKDVFRYNFSVTGLEGMKKSLCQKLKNVINEVQKASSSLRFDREIEEITQGFQEGLSSIDKESILRNLARNEMRRLLGRIIGLQQGKFDLRNEKPNKEITEYFCDYVSQLDDKDCGYDTVTFYDFWSKITDKGENFEYLLANIHAAKTGALIRRVFIIDSEKYPKKNVGTDTLFNKILARHYYDTEEYRDRIETRVFFSSNYKDDMRTYKNFGVWRKGSERILLKPEYVEDGRMSRTLFLYYDDQKIDIPHFIENKREVMKYENSFREIWKKSERLDTKHFQ